MITTTQDVHPDIDKTSHLLTRVTAFFFDTTLQDSLPIIGHELVIRPAINNARIPLMSCCCLHDL